MSSIKPLVLAALTASGASAHAMSISELFTGEAKNQQYGQTITALGDIDNDGVSDYAIGNTRYTVVDANTGKKLLNAGRVDIYSGADDTLLWQRVGTAAKQELGASIIAADVNADGKLDIAIGAPGNYLNSGLVVLCVQLESEETLSFKEHRIFGADKGSRFGSSLAVAPIINSVPANSLFLLVGSPLEKNSAEWSVPEQLASTWLYSLKPHKKRVGAVFGYRINLVLNKDVTEVSNLRIFGSTANSGFGSQLSWLSDSGLLAVAAPKHNKTGEVLLWDTAEHFSALKGTFKGENFGAVLQRSQLTIGENSEQLIVSAPLAANDKLKKAGRVDIYGTDDWQAPLQSWSGVLAGAEFGSAVSSVAGDSDTDGSVFIGSPKASNTSNKLKLAGLVQQFAPQSTDSIATHWGEFSAENFGAALAVQQSSAEATRVLISSPGYSSPDNKQLKKIGRISSLSEQTTLE